MTKSTTGATNGAKTKKRERIADKVQLAEKQPAVQETEVVEDETEVELDLTQDEEDRDFTLPNGEFDWDGYEAAYNTKLKRNKRVKVGHYKDIVYSHESYAQDMYNMLADYTPNQTKMELTVNNLEEGRIYNMSERWATVDIGYREMLYIDLSREDRDLIADLRPGDEVTVKVLSDKTENREYALASITEGTKQKVFTDLRVAAEAGDTAYLGTVKEMIPGGGYLVMVQGISCFMPGSLAGINKLYDFESIIGTKMYVVPTSFSQQKGTIVVSHRQYLQALIPNAIDALRNDLETEVTGFVTGTAKFGVFCEFNECLTGMIHANDLSADWADRHRMNEIKPGEEITFKIKEIVTNEKIILTQREVEVKVDNSWEEFTENLKVPSTTVGTIRSIKDYGLFIGVHGSVVGLAHISEFPEGTVLKDRFAKGQEISVVIKKIDAETKKVFLEVIEG